MAKQRKLDKQKTFTITLDLPQSRTRVVKAKGSTLEIAERRALKFNPDAIGVKNV